MSNPFAQGGVDPFGELVSSSQQASAADFKPTRRPPPKPAAPNPFSTNAFGQAQLPPAAATAPAAPAHDDPFGLLAATAPGAGGVSTQQLPAAYTAPQQQQTKGQAWDDDVFGIFNSGAHNNSKNNSSLTPPSYTEAAAAAPPPAYDSAVSLPPAYGSASSCAPAPPAYAHALDLTPPSYEDVISVTSQPQHHVQEQQFRPARAAPVALNPAGAVGPLTAARPSRPAPAAPGPSLAPARAPLAAPGQHGALGAAAPAVPARPAPRPPQAAAAGGGSAGGFQAAAGLSGLSLADAQASAGSGAQCAAATTGNVGAAPKGSGFGGQQVHQQELGAQIRLPPLNSKGTAPLKHLAAGMGSLFAGPVDDASLLLQWCPSTSGSTLPMGGSPSRTEDHDSAAAAALGPGQYASSGSKCRVSCVLFGPVSGRLWAGCADGKVYCWELAGDGSVARLLHSWEAHSGKVKGIALSPSGRLFTGSSSGAIKMWSYGSPAFTDSSAPRLLRQLKKVDSRSGVGGNPHSKVVGLAVSAGGRVLWSIGKASVSIWSTHNGEHLGSLSESGAADALSNPFAAGGGTGPYASPYTAQLQGPGSGAAAGDINPKLGLDAAVLDSLFERPSAELLAEEDAFDSEKDAASVAYNAAVKGAAKAGKLFNKLTKMAAAKLKEDNKLGIREDSTDSDHGVGPGSFSAGAAGSASPAADAAGLEGKVGRWGSIKKVAAAADGFLWLSYKRGLLERYSEGGQLLWSSSSSGSGATGQQRQGQGLPGASGSAGGAGFKPAGVAALAAVGSSVWVGDQQGRIWVLDAATGALQRMWAAHVFPVRSIAAAGHLVYSLSKDGGIRAWPACAPPAELTAAWRADTQDCLQQQSLQVLACTWNVNENKPSRPGLELWLGKRVKDAQLVLIGLQEVEMGTGSVALDVVYQQLAKSKLEAGTQAAQAWAAAITDVLSSKGRWKRVALRQMSGILALVFARAELEPHIGEVSTASVACGVMGYGGNKGAAAVSFSLFRRRVVLVSSHFAAHQDKVEARNADYAKVVRHLHFHNVPTDKPQQQSQFDASNSVILPSSDSDPYGSSSPRLQQQQQYGMAALAAAGSSGGSSGEDDWGAGMKDAEFLVWLGDFNYRVDLPEGFVPDRSNPERPVNEQLYHFVLQKIAARQHTDLLTGDQCGREMTRRSIFHGLAEGPVRFLPTYKFEKNRESSIMQPFYDQGEKMRVPAWTDRIFFRASAPQKAALRANPAETLADVRVSLAHPDGYSAVLEVNDSDHKPVYAQLGLTLPWYQQQQLRSTSLARLWQVAQHHANSSSNSPASFGDGSVRLGVEAQQLVLAGSHVHSEVIVRNPLQDASVCFWACAGASGVPSWLEVVPVSGVLRPGEAARLRVQGSKGGTWGRVGGGVGCELRVAGCVEGSIDSSTWPLGWVGNAVAVSIVLH